MNVTAICYLICWRYADNSATGVVGYSFEKEEAEAILTLLKEHGESRQFYLVGAPKLPVYG